MREYRHITMLYLSTGAVKFGNDWTGLYVRGDDCMRLASTLRKILHKEALDELDLSTLKYYLDEIENNVDERMKNPYKDE